MTFLGYTVSAEGTRPLEEKVKTINRFQQSVLVKELRRFLSILSCNRRFIPQAANILVQAPLHAALAGPKVKGSQPVGWTPTMVQAFENCKASLSSSTLLAHPNPSATLALFTDASDVAIGAALQQRVCDVCQLLAFYSRTTASSRQYMRPSTSDIWSKAVSLSSLRIKPLTYAFRHCRDMLTTTIPSPGVYWAILYWLQACLRTRHCSVNALSRAKSVTTPLYHAPASFQDAELQDILKNGSALRLERVYISGTPKLCPSEAEKLDVSESDLRSRSTYLEGLSFVKFTLYWRCLWWRKTRGSLFILEYCQDPAEKTEPKLSKADNLRIR